MKESIIPNKLQRRKKGNKNRQEKEIDDDIVQFLYFLQLHHFFSPLSLLAIFNAVSTKEGRTLFSFPRPRLGLPARFAFPLRFALLVLGRNPNKTFTLTHSEC